MRVPVDLHHRRRLPLSQPPPHADYTVNRTKRIIKVPSARYSAPCIYFIRFFHPRALCTLRFIPPPLGVFFVLYFAPFFAAEGVGFQLNNSLHLLFIKTPKRASFTPSAPRTRQKGSDNRSKLRRPVGRGRNRTRSIVHNILHRWSIPAFLLSTSFRYWCNRDFRPP